MLKTIIATLVIAQLLVLIFSKFTGIFSYSVILGYFFSAGLAAFRLKAIINGYESRNLESLNQHDKEEFFRSVQYIYYVYYFLLGWITFSFMILACFWKKIKLSIKAVKAAGIYTFGNSSTILTTLGICLLYIALIFYSGKYTAMKIQSEGQQYFDNSLPYMSYELKSKTTTHLKLAIIVFIFLFFVIMKANQYL